MATSQLQAACPSPHAFSNNFPIPSMTFSAVAGKCSTPAAVKAAAPRLTSPNVRSPAALPRASRSHPMTQKQAADEDPDQEDEVEFHGGTEWGSGLIRRCA